MKRLALAAALVLTAGSAHAQDKVYNGLSSTDLDAMSKVLRRHVAYLVIAPKTDRAIVAGDSRTGYGAVLEDDLVVTLAYLVQDIKGITVVGPKGRLPAEVVLFDLERRVALVRTKKKLATIGLETVRVSPVAERKAFMDVFALISTDETAGVLHTQMIHDGTEPAYEGHPRIDVLLQFGTPIFDNRARFIGFSRVVTWDADRYMIVPYEMITSARTSTAAPTKKSKAAEKRERPWWGR